MKLRVAVSGPGMDCNLGSLLFGISNTSAGDWRFGSNQAGAAWKQVCISSSSSDEVKS
jgi:hypothetical protein